MTRIVLAAVAAFALAGATPALGCPDCKDCPHKAAAADKTEKKDPADPKAAAGCPCGGAQGKECKCGPNCQCSHCAAKKAAKKEEPKKT